MIVPNYSIIKCEEYSCLDVSYNVDHGGVLTFFMTTDVVDFENIIKEMFDEVLLNGEESSDCSFNTCYLEIRANETIVCNLMDDDQEECVVNTRELYFLILDWCEKYHEFELQKGKH